MDKLDFIGAWALLAAAAPLTGCDPTTGTDTGNPFDDNGGEAAGGQCEDAEPREVGLDEDTGLGFTASDVWQLAQGVHEIDMGWDPMGPVGVGELAGTQTQLRVELSRQGSGARVVTSEPRQSTGQEPGAAIASIDEVGGEPCPDRVELDVTVQLSTADGALDESFAATLRSSDGVGARWRVDLDPSALAGNLELELLDAPEGSQIERLQVEMTHSVYAHQGSLSAMVEGDDGAAAWASFGELACWPEAGGCESGRVLVDPAETVFEFSAQDAFDALAKDLPDTLTWRDGSSTPLSLELAWAADAGVCAVTASQFGEPLSLSGPVTVTVRTDDGRIDANLELELRAVADDEGRLGQVSAQRQAYLASGVSADEFEATFGVHGVDLSGFDVASLQFQLAWEPGGTTGGSLAVLGGLVPECVSEPVPEPSENGSTGGGTAGCEGISYDEVETASF